MKLPPAKPPTKEEQTELVKKRVAAANVLHEAVFEMLKNEGWNPSKGTIFGQPSIRVVVEDERKLRMMVELMVWQDGNPGVCIHHTGTPTGLGSPAAPSNYLTYDEGSSKFHGPQGADALERVIEVISPHLAKGHSPN